MTQNSREIALKILREVDEKAAYVNISINRNIEDKLTEKDESFIREIVYGVIDNKLYIDWVIEKFSRIKFNKISSIIKNILRMAIYQIIFMDRVPDSAAVNEAVKLSKKYSHKGTYGFVNAVLRNIADEKNSIMLPDKEKDVMMYMSIKYSHPKWMIENWIKEFGVDFTESLCRENNGKPKLNIRVNTLKINRDDLMNVLSQKGFKCSKTKYSNDGIIIDNPTKITDTDEFKNGYFIIQDESSMLVAQVMNPKPGSLVLDMCSSPGGKATHIAQFMNNKGRIIARDIYFHKLKLIEENVKRLGIDIIETQLFDGLKLDNSLIEKVDYCLIDAPCSGLGLIRRKPDIKWRKTKTDLENIKELQYEILTTGSKYIKQNGVLVYSTCTIEKDENIRLIKRFLNENQNFKLISFDDLLPDDELLLSKKDGYLELYPNVHKTDGFFIAKLVRCE